MNFVTVEPENPQVKEVVSHYYFHENTNSNQNYEFVFYPHYKHAITAYIGSEIVVSSAGTEIRKNSNESINTLFTRLCTDFRTVKLIGRFQKVGIVLNPLGINKIPTNKLDPIQDLVQNIEFLDHENWENLLSELWSSTVDQRVKKLDEFFIKNISDHTRDSFEEEFLNILKNPESFTASKLADKLNLSERTLRRVFEKRVGFGFSKLKKIARFRIALENHNKNPNQNLTELALISQFYDQPDFTKHIKNISGQKPKAFFDSINNVGSGTYWRNL